MNGEVLTTRLFMLSILSNYVVFTIYFYFYSNPTMLVIAFWSVTFEAEDENDHKVCVKVKRTKSVKMNRGRKLVPFLFYFSLKSRFIFIL